MAHVRIETSVPRHRKFLAAGPAASWLWLAGCCYCNEGLTDGHIPAMALPTLGVPGAVKLAHRLVEVGLWERDTDGWRVHDYLAHNRTADQVKSIRDARAAGGKLGGRPTHNLPENLEGFPKVSQTQTLPENPITTTTTATTAATTSTPSEEQEISSATSAEPSVIDYPAVGKPPSWGLTQTQIDAWAALYPGLDVLAECRKAKAWLLANKRKTAGGMSRFLVNWLNQATNSGPRRAGGGGIQTSRAPFGDRTGGNVDAIKSFLDRRAANDQ